MLKTLNHIVLNKTCLCKAPTYAMHLAQNGDVLNCSYTRFDAIGKFPNNTLHDIWFGKAAEARRKKMKSVAFPSECNVCEQSFKAGQYNQMRSASYDKYTTPIILKAKQKTVNYFNSGSFTEYPKEISFELSNTCNLECSMCFGFLSSSIRKNREQLPKIEQTWDKRLLNQLQEFIPHLEEAKFFGGEPFLIDIYLDIWDLFIELNPNCKIFITTNGTILNERVKKIISSLPNLELVVSLDAITKVTYEKIRVNANFDKVMEHLVFFKEAMLKQNKRLRISPTYARLNAMEYPLLLDFANKEGFYFHTNFLITPSELSLAFVDKDELKSIHSFWKQYEPTKGIDLELEKANNNLFYEATEQLAVWYEEQKEFQLSEHGRVLFNIVPQTKIETCFIKALTHQLRKTKDIGFALQLEVIFAIKKNQVHDFFEALLKLTNILFPTSTNELKQRVLFVEKLITTLIVGNTLETHYKLIQHVLLYSNLWELVSCLKNNELHIAYQWLKQQETEAIANKHKQITFI